MGIEGVEPSTPRASVVCSPAELYPQKHNDIRFLKVVKIHSKKKNVSRIGHNVLKGKRYLQVYERKLQT